MLFEDENKLYETTGLKVYYNGSGEIFIKHKQSGHILRIGDDHNLIRITTSENCILTPISVNGLNGMTTYPRESIKNLD
jgi:hypothetical protein